jgi:hypothetical protein
MGATAAHSEHAGHDQEGILTCTLRCASAREAVSVAGELRELPGVRVGVQPAPLGHGCCDGWLVQLTTPASTAGPGAPARCRERIEDTLRRRAATDLLGWRLRSSHERAHTSAPASHGQRRGASAHAPHGSQRETVIASLLARPSEHELRTRL